MKNTFNKHDNHVPCTRAFSLCKLFIRSSTTQFILLKFFNNVLILRTNVSPYWSVPHIRDRTNYRDRVSPHTARSATAILTLAFGASTTRARPLHPTVTKLSSIILHLKTHAKSGNPAVYILLELLSTDNSLLLRLYLYYSTASRIIIDTDNC